ncbi:sorting nexin-29 [Amyelois transitella]|uniref:sorting nexin-29 n=1 Tax=Amyelois transitella TaxID=680683 RepID=UPI00298F7332|nr:sorting nexin-29 [Amyelois transitella]
MTMNSKILNTLVNAIDNKEDVRKRIENGKQTLQELLNCVQNSQNRFGGKSELATEDDIRITLLCDKWEKVLSHGIRTNLSNSALQTLVTAGLNFTFNIVNIGNSLWSYTCLHLTKHEKERFKILTNINTPLGYFRAFLRAALNERSLERYLHSWITHGLLMEYYEEGSLVRDPESSNLLPNMAAGLSSILFALSIDRAELNDTQHASQINKAEPVIPLPTPVRSSNLKRKPLRQVISFDKNEQTNKPKQRIEPIPPQGDRSSWNSAPATCLNSPDPKVVQVASSSEPTSTEYKSSIRHFFPESVKGIDSPSQILSRLSECAKEIFTSSNSIDTNNVIRDDVSELSINNMKISESDSEEVAGSINGSTSCLELCFTEDESVPEDKHVNTLYGMKEKEYLNLQLKCSQIEIASKEKIQKLEKVVMDLSKENDRLKDQLRQYMSAVELGIALKNGESENEEVSQYEKKLVQVAEMHAELMEFNQHLQRRLRELEETSCEILDYPESNVKVHIPSAFLVGKKTHSYHVYQIFLKLGQEEWNVYHRYAKFHELHTQLKKCHPDIATYKFPPKKTLRKRDAHVVECRRVALQAYLRHVLLVLPELRQCTSRAHLVTLLPFFGISSTRENGLNHTLDRQQSTESVSTYDGI